ncbi:MAG: hypothetical protein Ta2A_19550 [Treponemataceae bacterium]|nr:MAG: hypothetical protein Ta2A_19550 [Treponemataceae bacterium]
MKKMQLYILLSLLFFSCDRSGNVFLKSGYLQDVTVISSYSHENAIIDREDVFSYLQGWFAVAARSHDYDYIIGIEIKTMEGLLLAKYDAEYLSKLRAIYKQSERTNESWIFSEQGLFLTTIEVYRKFEFDSDKILEYYCSDEAAKDLEKRLHGTL